MRVEQLLERLDGVKRGSDGQWYARCPAHDDRQASLTIAEGRDGRILLTCWAGCELETIVHAINADVRDLFVSRDERALRNGPAPWGDRTLGEATLPLTGELKRMGERLLADEPMLELLWERKGWKRSTLAAIGIGQIGDRVSIPVHDLGGKVVNHLRYRPDAQPKMLATKGRPRTPLYFVLDDDTVWIVEGETDAISLAMLGLSVIGAPGASAKVHSEWLEPVRGKHALVCFDKDGPGRKAAHRWAHAAHEYATDVRIVELVGDEGIDVGDVVRVGRNDTAGLRRQLLELADSAPLYVETKGRSNGPVGGLSPEDVVLGSDDDDAVGAIVSTRADTIRTELLRNLWRGRIPVGRVGIVFGPPGHGKSTFTALLVGDVTRAGGRVLIASAEDNAATTLVPRMAAADAALERVEIIETRASKGTTNIVLPRDLDALAERMSGRSLLIVDPLSAHLGDDVNSWSEQSVRSTVLAPLAWHAAVTGCAVALIMHVTKSDKGDPLSRIQGSGGFGGAARFALLLGTHPDDVGLEDELAQRLVLVHVKASESAKQSTMVFRRRIVNFVTDDGPGDDDELAMIPVLELVTDQSTIEPELVLMATDPEERGAYSEALAWLRRELSGAPQQSKRLLAAARERGDFSERTLRKAKRALHVRSEREQDGWYWVLDPPKGDA